MQLALNLALRDEATFDNFTVGDNRHLVSCIKNVVIGKEHFAYLYGNHGAGKSHLLQAACHAAGIQRKTSVYLPLADHEHLSPYMLEGLESLHLVCIDDIHLISGHSEWEESLMHLYNRLKQNENGLIISGNAKPNMVGLQLNDLSSRLNWGLIFKVHGLDDEQKVTVLETRAYNRGIRFPRDVGKYLIRHGSRNMTELFSSLECLERESLIAKKKLTLPFVKKVLGI